MPAAPRIQTLQAVQRIQSRYIADGDAAAALDALLVELLHLSGSTAGLLATVAESGDAFALQVHALQSSDSCAVACRIDPPRVCDLALDSSGVLDAVLRHGRPARTRWGSLPAPLAAMLPGLAPDFWAQAYCVAMGTRSVGLALLAGQPPGPARRHSSDLEALLQSAGALLAAADAPRANTKADSGTGRTGDEGNADWRHLVETLPHGVIVVQQGLVVFANQAAAAALGCKSANDLRTLEALGAAIALKHRERLHAMLRAHEAGAPLPDAFELCTVQPSAALHWLECSAHPIEWAGQRALALALADITAHRTDAEDQARQRRLLQTVFDAFPFPLYVKDADARYRMVNRKFAEHAGMQAADIIGRTVEVLGNLTRESKALVAQQDRQVIEVGRPMELPEFHSVLSSGEELYQTIIKHPLRDAEGRMEGLLGLTIDITRRTQAQRRAEAQERLLRAVLDAIPHPISVKDLDGRYIITNDTFAREACRPVDRLAGMRTQELDFLAPALRQRLDTMDREVLEHRHVTVSEDLQMNLADGAMYFRQFVKAPLPDAKGLPAGIVTVSLDTTQRVLAEARLRESQRLLQTVFDAIPHMIAVKDRLGRYVMVNPAYRRLFGISEQLLIGRTAEEVVELGTDARERFAKHDEQILSGAVANLTIESLTTLPDGRRLHLDSLKTALLDEQGRIDGLVGVTIDVTRRREAEAREQVALARLRDAIESLPAVFMLYDAQERLVLWNSQVTRFFPEFEGRLREGMTYEEVARLSAPYNVVSPNAEDYVEARLSGFRRTEAGVSRQRTDGHWIQFYDRRTADGGTVSLRFDITELRTREAELRQALKMEAVGQLTGGVAHDFNNLLTVVLGNLELLRHYVPTESKAVELLERATAASERGAALTQRLLAFSRSQTLQPRPTDLNALVQGMHDLLRRTLGETIQVEMHLAPALWPTMIDPAQLENALLNLAINARDAMPEGGRLLIETSNTWLDASFPALVDEVRPGPYAVLAVRDTGCGVPSDLIDRVFDPFFTTKEVGKGSGLGLSMVYGFVQQSAGQVRLDSETCQGTTVRMYLPRAPDEASESPSQTSLDTTPAGESQRVLVVEDDPHISVLAKELLKELGYEALLANNASEAMTVLEGNPAVTVLFTDVVLPGGRSGIDLAREARALRPDLRVLFTTGYTESELMRRSLIDHDAQLLEKPYHRRDLARKLGRVLSSAGS
ncbi:MAG TPA: PAS domain-containing protein [bacterium]|nr:PAS domain-containing protein [bacterium]